jgi:hypothetical protein
MFSRLSRLPRFSLYFMRRSARPLPLARQKSMSPSTPTPYIIKHTQKSYSNSNARSNSQSNSLSNIPKRSLNRSIKVKNQNGIRELKLPHYYDEDVFKELNKINKELLKHGKYRIGIDYYDKIEEEVHHYYGDNSGFGNQRPLIICLFHHDTCVSSLFFERVKKNGKDIIEINKATHETYERRGISSFLTAIAIRVIHLGFKYKEIYSSAINTISAWILIKDYDVSTLNVDTGETEMTVEMIKKTFPNFESVQRYYKIKDSGLMIKIPIKKNIKKALEIEKKLFIIN